MSCSSAGSTEGCLAGSSRNHFHQANAQKNPIEPKIQKLARHPAVAISATASGGARAPPSRVPIKVIPWARPRSLTGNHCEKLREVLGNAPASPAPNRNRKVSRETKLHAIPVAMVNADHHKTIRVSTFLGPIVSPSHPLGISKIA